MGEGVSRCTRVGRGSESLSVVRLRSVALLVFFPAAAGAGVVAAHFLVASLNSLSCDWFFSAIEDERWLGTRDDGGRCGDGRLLFVSNRLYMEEPIKRVGLDSLHHAGKEIVAFSLVLNERIFLSIAAQSDPVAQMIHPEKMIFPVVVDDLEHEGLFQEAHQLRAQVLLSPIIGLARLRAKVFEQCVSPHGAE